MYCSVTFLWRFALGPPGLARFREEGFRNQVSGTRSWNRWNGNWVSGCLVLWGDLQVFMNQGMNSLLGIPVIL